MFRVLSDIHLDSGSVRIIPITRNTTKQDSFGIYVRVQIGSDSFLSDRIRFRFSGSVYLSNPNCHILGRVPRIGKDVRLFGKSDMSEDIIFSN